MNHNLGIVNTDTEFDDTTATGYLYYRGRIIMFGVYKAVIMYPSLAASRGFFFIYYILYKKKKQ